MSNKELPAAPQRPEWLWEPKRPHLPWITEGRNQDEDQIRAYIEHLEAENKKWRERVKSTSKALSDLHMLKDDLEAEIERLKAERHRPEDILNLYPTCPSCGTRIFDGHPHKPQGNGSCHVFSSEEASLEPPAEGPKAAPKQFPDVMDDELGFPIERPAEEPEKCLRCKHYKGAFPCSGVTTMFRSWSSCGYEPKEPLATPASKPGAGGTHPYSDDCDCPECCKAEDRALMPPAAPCLIHGEVKGLRLHIEGEEPGFYCLDCGERVG